MSPSIIAPVIGSVAAVALSLSEVQVTVTLSDTGGQPVEEYTVSYVRHECVSRSETISALSPCHDQVTINGTVMMFSGSTGLQFIGNVTGLALITGLRYSVSVVARNSVGSSEAFTGTVFVPCECMRVANGALQNT